MSAAARNPRPLAGRGQGVGGVPTHLCSHANTPRHFLNRQRQLAAPHPLPLPRKGEGGASLGAAA
jgi:hypothetical protein